MQNWKTAKTVTDIGKIYNIPKEALFEIAMLQIRLSTENIEQYSKEKAESTGKHYEPSIVYWDAIEAQMRALYKV